MALTDSSNFEDWLQKKLNALDIDSDIYGNYITGVLQEEDEDDKQEALTEILSSFMEDSNSLCNEVLQTWKKMNSEKDVAPCEDKQTEINDILAAHVVAQKREAPPKETKSSDELAAVKKSVIAMYSSVADEEEFDESITSAPQQTTRKTIDDALELFENKNAETVNKTERQERVKQKEDASKKKEKDKQDRELQKIKKAERKDKEKKRTQKKERGR